MDTVQKAWCRPFLPVVSGPRIATLFSPDPVVVVVVVRVSGGARLQGHFNLSASRNLAPWGLGNGGSRWQDEGLLVTLSHHVLLLHKPRPSSLTYRVLLCEWLPKQDLRKSIED